MLKITISGPPKSGKSWAALLIKATLATCGGAVVEVKGEDLDELETGQRMLALMNNELPLKGVLVVIEQQRAPIHRAAQPLESIDELVHEAEQFGGLLDYAILSTATGPKREALTAANIYFREAMTELQKALES